MNGGSFPPYTNRKPYGSCPHCKRAIEPHGVTCVYCGKPYVTPSLPDKPATDSE